MTSSTDGLGPEERLRDSLREVADLKAALDEHAIVAITDPRGKITYVNDKFCAISKYSRDELLGQDHRVINSGYHPKAFIHDLWRTIGQGRVWNGEIKNRAKDGTFYWVATTIVPFVDERGKPRQHVAIRADITSRKEAEAALRSANETLEANVAERTAELQAAIGRLEAAGRMKSEFLANMSHELRTPLNGIIGFSEFLFDGKPGPLNSRQKEYLGDILNSSRHLLYLINGILDLAKIEAGKMEFNPETFAVIKAIEEVGAVVRPMAEQKRITMLSEVQPELGEVELDLPKFKQILYNLLSNAVKFTADGGRIEVRAEIAPPSHFRIAVKDNGIGIKTEDIPRLFTEFEQLDSGVNRRFQGTGLGLALTRRLAEHQGGGISVASEAGLGSIFTVLLPRKAPRTKQ